MGLKNILSTLLPLDYREQVLGDLQERGFRLHDVVSVVPRVWWSHLSRSGAPGADADFRLRCAQERLEARQKWFILLYTATVAIGIQFDPGTHPLKLAFLSILVAASLALILRKSPTRDYGHDALLKYHRQRLEFESRMAQMGFPFLFFATQVAGPVMAIWGPGVGRPIRFLAVVSAFALGHLRARRLRRELASIA